MIQQSKAHNTHTHRVLDFILRCGPAQASPLRSEASRTLRSGEKIELLPPAS
jgi:hypothetical protein